MLRASRVPCALVLVASWLSPAEADGAEPTVEVLTARLGRSLERDVGQAGQPIVRIDLHGSAVTDADLAAIGRVTTLRQLDLRKTAVTDAGLVHLRGLRALETLNLFRTGIGDAGLAHLAGLTALRTISWAARGSPMRGSSISGA
jgi:hypothetical protein